jgi:serine acetyltransferase
MVSIHNQRQSSECYGATILSGVRIGNGAVIGSQAVVASDIPDYTVAVGNPAKVIRSPFPLKSFFKYSSRINYTQSSQTIPLIKTCLLK